MNKVLDFAAVLSAKYGLQQKDALRFVNTMLDVVRDGLHQDRVLKIKGLGTFKVTSVDARESVDVNTGERIVIDGRDKITFAPETALKERVNGPFAQFTTVDVNDGVDFSAIDKKYEQLSKEQDMTEEKHVPDGVQPEAPVRVTQSSLNAALDSSASTSTTTVSGIQQSQASDAVEHEGETYENLAQQESQTTVTQKAVTDKPLEKVLSAQLENQSATVEEQSAAKAEVAADVQESQPAESAPNPSTEVKPEKHPDEAESSANDLEAVKSEKTVEGHEEKTAQNTSNTHATQKSGFGHAKTAEDIFDAVYRKQFREDMEEEWQNREERNGKLVRRLRAWLIIIIAVMLVVGGSAFYMLYRQIAIRDSQIAMLLTMLSEKNNPDGQKADSSVVATSAMHDSGKHQKAVAHVKKAAPKMEASVAHPAASASKAALKSVSKVTPPTAPSKYDSDPRIRTGAYRIVGIDRTVKLRKGQTMSSVGRAWLGPGMDCYMEAVNGRKQFQAGDVVKIPKLERKKKNKQ